MEGTEESKGRGIVFEQKKIIRWCVIAMRKVGAWKKGEAEMFTVWVTVQYHVVITSIFHSLQYIPTNRYSNIRWRLTQSFQNSQEAFLLKL